MTKKIKKILIANRGEIACRVMKTARKLGIKTVAVYSDADKKALHTRTADEAVHIGASPAAESYLVIDKIIDACKQTGADAVHPGYGFLSENPAFVRACDAAGVIFIGPKAESMEAMGLKDAAKKLMIEAGVPVTPGYHGEDQTPDLLKSKAGMIGYPVLIKAVAGGGGKGMRKVEAEEDFIAALESCQREAKSSFGDDRVLVEKYITSPRHIEVQVFGDTHGNVVHMFERDCSLQRRHQKVIEEAPAPGMTEDVRKAMTDAAVQAAKAVDYVGAGTVEFIVDGSGALRPDGFWFMEMNTRLQVEHPVSEMITGLDFVELQIRVAEGGKLPEQTDINMDGHAIEARLYAEDPANDFLPSVGKLELFEVWEEGVRVDTGVKAGDAVSIYYDPMIAKVISHKSTRPEAIETLSNQLECSSIWPVRNNCSYLIEVISNHDFRAGQMSTHTLPDFHEIIADELTQSRRLKRDYAIWKIIDWETGVNNSIYRHGSNFNCHDNIRSYAWRLNLPAGYSQTYFFGDEMLNVSVDQFATPWTYRLNDGGLCLEDKYFPSRLSEHGDGYLVTSCGETIQILKTPSLSDSHNASNALTAPMPGKIIAVNAAPGDTVKAGDPLIIMEAMKMEMTLEAPRDGIVGAVNVEADALVSDGDVLLEMEEN